jgi:hypothetical protein
LCHLLALVIQDAEQPTRLSLNHGQAASIVLKVDALPLDPLLAVLLLLVLEHMLIEVKLQMLVGIVDAELLIAVKVKKLSFNTFQTWMEAKRTCCSF